MNSEKPGNGASSGATSAKPLPNELNESDYLTQQAEEGRKAMSQALAEFKTCLATGVNPRLYVENYPWISVAGATVAGFVMGSAVTPTRDESLRHRIKSLFPEHKEVVVEVSDKKASDKKPSMLSSVLGPVVDALKTILVASISSAVAAQPQQPEASPATAVAGQ